MHAVAHHRHAIRQRERFLLVVRHEHRRDAEPLLQAAQLDLHLLAQHLVERAERLVEQQHGRLDDDRARERDALLLSAGQLPRIAVGKRAELDELERLVDRLARARCARRAACAGRTRRSRATVRCGNSA